MCKTIQLTGISMFIIIIIVPQTIRGFEALVSPLNIFAADRTNIP
jgi:hypothetical protein